MPRGCRVLLLQQSERRDRLRSLSRCGYRITPSEGGDLPLRLFATGACVLVLDPAATGVKPEDAVRLARIAGIPVIALGAAPAGTVRGADQRLPAGCDDVTLVAAVEVACYGHDHEREDAAAPGSTALARTGTER